MRGVFCKKHFPPAALWAFGWILALLLSDGHYSRAEGFFLLAKNQITFNGAVFDSYDSTDPAYSTRGLYDHAKAKDGCNIASSAVNISNVVDIGNANVFGHVSTGSGSSVNVASGGTIGSIGWRATNFGVEPEWVNNYASFYLTDVVPPDHTLWPTPVLGMYSIGGTNYSYKLGTGGYYASSFTLNSGDNMIVTGHATFCVGADITTRGGALIYIAPGGSLNLYVGGVANISGGGILNWTEAVTNFCYFGLPGNTSIKYTGASDLVGLIYAPSADFTILGGASLYGAAVVNTFSSLSAGASGHYDESLAHSGWLAAYPAPGSLSPLNTGTDGSVHCTVSGSFGFKFAVEASTNLLDWVPLATNTCPFMFSDPDATNFSRRFYRSAFRQF